MPFAGSLAEWDCSAMRMRMQRPATLLSLGVSHKKILWMLIFLPYFFTLLSRHGNKCGPTHRITNCSQWSHCFSVAVLQLLQEAEIMLASLQIRHNFLTYMNLLQGAPHKLLHSVLCTLPFHTPGRSAHVLTNAEFSMVRDCCMVS
jgi:hypothetical protein